MADVYSDIDMKLRKVSGSNDISKVTDDSAINQSLLSLLNTSQGERLFNLKYGTKIKKLLFEPMDILTANRLIQEIENAILNWESSRIHILDLKLNINYDTQAYDVSLEYQILNTQKTGLFEIVLQKV